MKFIIAIVLLFPFYMANACEFMGWYGEGKKEAVVGIEWSKGKNVFFGYRFNGEKTGADMLREVARNEKGLKIKMIYKGGVVKSITWDANGNGIIDDDDWSLSGFFEGDAGFWAYWIKDDRGDEWYYSDMGLTIRPLEDGSIDMWKWSEGFDTKKPGKYQCL